jgi:hypothetical protein
MRYYPWHLSSGIYFLAFANLDLCMHVVILLHGSAELDGLQWELYGAVYDITPTDCISYV